MIKGILFDIGGVILAEESLYTMYLATLKETLRRRGVRVSQGAFEGAVQECIRTFSPNLRAAVVWHFTKPDRARHEEVCDEARQHYDSWSARARYNLVPGALESLEVLSQKHALVLAANASAEIREVLQGKGVLSCFAGREVSEDIGYSKPDLRFFMHILDKAGLQPGECVMVGDRLDNDIIPAQTLGMRTVRVTTGLYRVLEPRTPGEIPHAEVESIAELPNVIHELA